MRSSGACPKCRNRRLLHITQIADRTDGAYGHRIEEGTDPKPAHGLFLPWRVARVPNPSPKWNRSDVAAAGLVQAYVCRACGLTEFYTLEPDSIPVDGETVVEIETPEPPPYR